jgi:hypothetical protein
MEVSIGFVFNDLRKEASPGVKATAGDGMAGRSYSFFISSYPFPPLVDLLFVSQYREGERSVRRAGDGRIRGYDSGGCNGMYVVAVVLKNVVVVVVLLCRVVIIRMLLSVVVKLLVVVCQVGAVVLE